MKRTTLNQLTKYVATGVAVAMLSACGGGGGSSSSKVDANSSRVASEGSEVVENNETLIVIPNHLPVITSATTVTIAENQNSVMTITATDEDNDTIGYSIEGGVDGAKVAINSATGVVVLLENPDFETKASYRFRVGASDGIDMVSEEILVNISDIFEGSAPVITTGDVSVNENQKSAFTIVATDVDGDTIGYSFEGGVDDSSFDLNATTGVVTFKSEPDYETKDSYQVTVGASDGHDTTTKDITVSILDLQGGSRVLQTGQSTRYMLKDDGDYLAGVERNFYATGVAYNHVVKDLSTGLYWKDNSYIARRSYDDAKNYCHDLDMGGYTDWRLPHAQELVYLANRGANEEAIFDEFDYTDDAKAYWSDTKTRAGSMHYIVDFKKGDTLFAIDTQSLNVRCVRENLAIVFPLFPFDDYSRFSRVNGIISDNDKNLQWYEPRGISNISIFPPSVEFEPLPATTGTFQEAIEGCEALVADGKNDWRLPNINELLSIVDYSKDSGTMLYSEFKSIETGEYFSSTTSDSDSDRAWTLVAGLGLASGGGVKTSTKNYRCVRTMGD